MTTPTVGSQPRTQTYSATGDETPPAPLGATRVKGSQPGSTQRTGGNEDAYQASNAKKPPFKQNQTLGSTTGGVSVKVNRDPGDYYCEHAFFIANELGNQPGTSISRDRNGQPMVTFLHHPEGLDDPSLPTDKRQAGAREVVGTVLRGYVDQAQGQVPGNEPIKVLLTGYGTFKGAEDNQTENFVTNASNIDAAMEKGFGAQLVRSEDGTPKRTTQTVSGQPVYQYTIKGKDGQERNVQVMAGLLPVNDGAIDGGKSSLQQMSRDFSPNIIINQGAYPDSDRFNFETRADDGGMRRTDTLTFTEGSETRVSEWEYENASGANAYLAGKKAIQADESVPKKKSDTKFQRPVLISAK